MSLKFSKYNKIVKLNDEYIVFNTRTLSLLLFEQKYIDMIENDDVKAFVDSFKPEEVDLLIENGIILESDIDELKIIKDEYWFNKYTDETLNISILTTLACNFACPYCFETRRNVRLTPKIENAIFEFIKEQSVNKKFVHVDWYGGEPLLNYDSIKSLSQKLIKLSAERGFTYYSSITTNGYLLNKEKIDELVKYNLRSAQITLDGPKEIHDKMRPLINQEGTYDTIINNIRYATQFITINLRVNINAENHLKIDGLLEEIKNIPNLNLAIKAIVPASYKEYNKDVLSAQDYANIVINKYKYAQRLGINTAIDNIFEGSMHRYCIVDSDSQFIISPTGKIFKCGESYADDEKGIIGGLDENGRIVIDDQRKPFWDKDPFSFEECKNCILLPLCLGGCQMKRLIKKVEPCSPEYKYSLDELIKIYYNLQNSEG